MMRKTEQLICARNEGYKFYICCYVFCFIALFAYYSQRQYYPNDADIGVK